MGQVGWRCTVEEQMMEPKLRWVQRIEAFSCCDLRSRFRFIKSDARVAQMLQLLVSLEHPATSFSNEPRSLP